MTDRSIISSTALQALILLLHLGKASYREDILAEGRPMIFSPLAGKVVDYEQVIITLAGPQRGDGAYHVVITMRTPGYQVEAYCKVAYSRHLGVVLIEPDVYVGGQDVRARNVSVDRKRLDPWALPEGFDLDSVLEAIKASKLSFVDQDSSVSGAYGR